MDSTIQGSSNYNSYLVDSEQKYGINTLNASVECTHNIIMYILNDTQYNQFQQNPNSVPTYLTYAQGNGVKFYHQIPYSDFPI